MDSFRKLLTLLTVIFLLTACGTSAPTVPPAETTVPTSAPTEPVLQESVDHAGLLRLVRNNGTVKQEVTVKTFIDGDTVHFHVPEDVMPGGVLKARFLAVNTPESTGKIEEYGKAASNFTREKLSAATSILIESETDSWDPDSTGDRYLVWVWYKTAETEEYRNLNVEILQNGLAIANGAAGNQYGSTCMAAIDQAKREKLNLYSGKPDPDFYYGDAVELTLRELRTNIESYSGMKVAFNGVITSNSGTQGVYVEDFDPETGMYYGIYIYYGHGLSGAGLDVLTVGNEVRIVGSVQFYEGGGTWQVSDLTYRMMQPKDPGNIQKISEGHAPAYTPVSAREFVSQVTVPNGEGELTASWAALSLGTTVSMENLEVVDVYTTDNPDSSSNGAMTLLCRSGDVTVTVRTAVLLDENGTRITADAYLGKTIDVKGIVDFFDGDYQIKVFTAKNITIK